MNYYIVTACILSICILGCSTRQHVDIVEKKGAVVLPVREAEPFDIRNDIMKSVEMGSLAVIFDCFYDEKKKEIIVKRSSSRPYLPPGRGTAEGYDFLPLVTIPRKLSQVILFNGETPSGFIEFTDKVELQLQLMPQLVLIDDQYVALAVYAKRTVTCKTIKQTVNPWLFENRKMLDGFRSAFDISPITIITFKDHKMINDFANIKVTGDLEPYVVEGEIVIDHQSISLKEFSE